MKQGTNKLPVLGNISRFPRNLLPQDEFHFSSLAGNQTDFFDSESGRILASLGVPDCGTSNLQAEVIFISRFFSIKDYNLNLMTPINAYYFPCLFLQIDFIREVFPAQSRDDITLVLQSCDYDVEKAIACFEDGKSFEVLKIPNSLC